MSSPERPRRSAGPWPERPARARRVRRRSPATVVALAVTLVVGLALTACGSDDGASTRSSGCGAAASGAGGSSASGADTGQGSGGRLFSVVEDEWTVRPQAPTVAAGKVRFRVDNRGQRTHELVVVRGVRPADLPLTREGRLDESKLPKGAVLGEVEGVTRGAHCEKTFTLKPGRYVLLCNLVDGKGSAKRVHLAKGMEAELRVR